MTPTGNATFVPSHSEAATPAIEPLTARVARRSFKKAALP
jgi:hypothetical protein